jgi:hypothetical protein
MARVLIADHPDRGVEHRCGAYLAPGSKRSAGT